MLRRQPNNYLHCPSGQYKNAASNYRFLVYELDEAGRQALRERGFNAPPKRTHHNFVHELMVSRIMFSFELGAREFDHTMIPISWEQIQEKMPDPKSEHPHQLPVSFFYKGKNYTKLIPDSKPFGFERGDSARDYLMFFPGIEADTGTEPLQRIHSDGSDIAMKFTGYLEAINQQVHVTHFGFPKNGFFVPFIFGSIQRMNDAMALLKKMTDGKGSPNFIFNYFTPFSSPETPEKPSGRMLTYGWLRVEHSPISLIGGRPEWMRS